ncbi:MAG: hypothetical protein GY947_04775 [Rhodobacteraceae bacterium]|nr:hypothetical protein [Paracoccaceae bacterium]
MFNRDFNDPDIARKLGGDFVLCVTVALFVTVVTMILLVSFFSFLPIQTQVTLSIVAGGCVSLPLAFRLHKRKLDREARTIRKRNEGREAETQKQIDVMLRDASNVPKVSRKT